MPSINYDKSPVRRGVLLAARPAALFAALVLVALTLLAPTAPAQEAASSPEAPAAGTDTLAAPASETDTAAVVPMTPPPTGSVDAQVAYRQGREAQRRNDMEAARRHYLTAAEQDATFPDPHYAIASTWLPFRPGAAASAYLDGLRAQWTTFRGQHRLVLNLAFILISVIAGSIVATTLLIGVRGLHHFQHPIFEYIQKKVPNGPAALAAWIIVVQPVLWGMGLYLTLVLAMGLLWAYLNSGERKITIACLAMAALVPMAFNGLSRLSAPFNPESLPYLLSAASETPDLPGLRESLQKVAAADPTDPEPHLALGLVSENQRDLVRAEAEYRKAIELGGSEGRAGNNLGNVLQETGRLDEATQMYQRAIAAEPHLAAPHFNLSQVYARRLQFDLVDHEMKIASELDFEGIRGAMVQTNAGHRKLLPLGAAPEELWNATFDSDVVHALGMPRQLSWLYDGSFTLLPFFALLLFGVGFVVGGRIHQFLPTYCCANCGTVVCRKCLRRIRRRAYCVNCGDTILSLKTSEFTRMLLDKRLRDEAWPRRVAHFLFTLVIPGWEAVRRGRPFVGLSVVTVFMIFTVPSLVNGMPVKSVPALRDVPGFTQWIQLGIGLCLLYGLSALILKALPEAESGLMEAELGMMSNSADRFDRAA